MASGLGGVALCALVGREGQARAAAAPLASSPFPHFAPCAKRVLQIFCPGGLSHLDSFDFKPALLARDGQPNPGEEGLVSFQGKNGPLMRSPWGFTRRGECGKFVSDMLPGLGAHVDDIAFIHSMTSRTNTHGPGCVFMNTGFVSEGFPSAGAWASYALGSLNDNLPAYVAIPDVRGEPPNGKANWSAGFLPARHQGIEITAAKAIRNLARPGSISAEQDEATRRFVEVLNDADATRRGGDDDLRARVAAYQLAARMQMTAPEATDLSREPMSAHALYGTSDANPLKAAYAKNCLLARRLLERGVRFVTLYCASRASGVDGLLNWDAHKTLKADYERHMPVLDAPTAALLTDLKQRGMMDDTLVLFTTEFGRMPTRQEGTAGRDHNPDGFTCWMAGAGIRGGTSYGETDDFGRRAVENVATVYDFYATVLHLLGLDHERLTYYHNGAARRLTDVHGKVIRAVLS
jgi:uncharacterized protein (DUF1501 family)